MSYGEEIDEEGASLGETLQIVAFHAGGSAFAIDIAHINSIIMPQVTSSVPRTPPYVRGVINLRGRIVPILDLRARFDLSEATEAEQSQQRVLVVEVDGVTAGLTVDSVSEVLHLPLSRMQPPSELVNSEDSACIRGIGRTEDDRLLIVLDVAKTLTYSNDGLSSMRELQDRINHPADAPVRKKAA